MQPSSAPSNIMKELNECQVSPYKKKQKILPESSGWVKKEKKKKSRGNEAKGKAGMLGVRKLTSRENAGKTAG